MARWPFILTVLFCSVSTIAQSAELKVLTAGAFKPVLAAIAPVFEKSTGHTLIIENDTAGALAKRIEGGETFDLAFLPPNTVKSISEKGLIATTPQADVARVAIGVAVKEGAKAPAIASTDELKTTLLNAKSIAVIDPKAGGSSGIYLAQLFQKWSIADQLQPKLILVPGGLVATRVVAGEAELALHQISEIIAVPGAQLIGPLPAEIQNYTVYRGAVAARSIQKSAAEALLQAMAGPEVAAILKAKGMEPPAP